MSGTVTPLQCDSGTAGYTRTIPPVPQAYTFVGNGYCTAKQGGRPRTWIINGGQFFSTDAGCANLCNMDSDCAGFMIQDMSIYGHPPACCIISPFQPKWTSIGGSWSEEQPGASTDIAGHDGETRDRCFKMTGSRPPAPSPPPFSPPPAPSPSPGPPLPPSYSDLGAGFCTGPSGRPQTYLCDTTGAKPGCPASQSACAALCTADASCTGFMTQTMETDPSTCNLVTSNKPNGAGTWNIQQAGKGLQITGHDHEARDHCWKKTTGPPAPPLPPGPPPPGPPLDKCSEYALVLGARFAWNRAGNASLANGGLSWRPTNLLGAHLSVQRSAADATTASSTPVPTDLVRRCTANGTQASACLVIPFTGSAPIAFTTNDAMPTFESTVAEIARCREAEQLASYAAYGPELRDVKMATQASIAWQSTYTVHSTLR